MDETSIFKSIITPGGKKVAAELGGGHTDVDCALVGMIPEWRGASFSYKIFGSAKNQLSIRNGIFTDDLTTFLAEKKRFCSYCA